MRYLKENWLNIFIYIGAGIFYAILSLYFKKNLLTTFLKEDFLTVLIALLAIYIPTITVLLSKIDLLKKDHPYFNTLDILIELKIFVRELIAYIFVVLIVMATYSSKTITIGINDMVFILQCEMLFLSVLFSILIANIMSLYDLCMTLILLYSDVITKDS